MFKLADAKDFSRLGEISKCNREILQKHFHFLRLESNSERTATHRYFSFLRWKNTGRLNKIVVGKIIHFSGIHEQAAG